MLAASAPSFSIEVPLKERGLAVVVLLTSAPLLFLTAFGVIRLAFSAAMSGFEKRVEGS